ncbi:hypothetical protein ACFPPF_22975 [Xenophilus aerolatus]|nr:hypothetical protein [Xenophilus aerolatus]
MADDVLRVLCALAAFTVPMLFAWVAVHFGVRRHRRGRSTAANGARHRPPT